MVGFETGPMAEGRPNDPIPLNFLHICVTAISKGERGRSAQELSKQMMQLQSLHTVSAELSLNVKWSAAFLYMYIPCGFNGKWCWNCHGKPNCKNWVVDFHNS